MNKKLVSALGISLTLLLASCSTGGTAPEANPSSTETAKVQSETPSPSPTAEATKKEKLKPEDYNNFDAKFKIVGGTVKSAPYGVNYDFLTAPSQAQYFSTYSTKDVHAAAAAGLETYYNIRTEPEFMKTDRTIAKDAKVLDKYSKELGNLLKDAWKNENQLFSYAPFYPFLNAGVFTYDESKGKTVEKHLNDYKSYYVDTREVHTVEFLNAVASESIMDQNSKPTLELLFDEKVTYALEDAGKGVYNSEIKLLMQKNSKGDWQVQGMYWNGVDMDLKDAEGNPLPAK